MNRLALLTTVHLVLAPVTGCVLRAGVGALALRPQFMLSHSLES
jgi:hypothetical protein